MPVRPNYYLYTFCLLMLMSSCGVRSGGFRANSLPPFAEDSAGVYLSYRIDGFVRSLAPQTFNGALVVEREGELIIANGYGYANYQQQLPFTTATLTNTAKLAQQFTAAAILKLQAQNVLHLQDSLARFFPDMPAGKKGIMLRQLLEHTSGLPQELSAVELPRKKKEFLESVGKEPLLFQAGSSYQYSEAGYRLLAAVVEAASGLSYEAFIRQELLLPSKIENTGYVLPEFKELVPAWEKGGEQSIKELMLEYREANGDLWHLLGSAGVLSTAADIYRWERMLLRGDILPAKSRDLLKTIKAESPAGREPFGRTVDKHTFGTPMIGHISREGDFMVQVLDFPEEKLSVVLLANQFNGQVEQLGMQIARTALWPQYVPSPLPYAEQKFVRVPQVEEARYARSLLSYLQEGSSINPQAIVDSVFNPAFKANDGAQTHLNALTSLKKRLGNARLEKAQQAWPQYMFTFYEPTASTWYLLRLNVEQQAPYKITGIGLETVDALNARW